MRLGILDCDRLDPDLVGISAPFTPRCLSRASGRWPRAGVSGLVGARWRAAYRSARVRCLAHHRLAPRCLQRHPLDPGAARLDPACPRCRRQAGRGLLRPPGDRPGAGGEVMKSTKGWGWGYRSIPCWRGNPGWSLGSRPSGSWPATRIRWSSCHRGHPAGGQ